MKMGDKVVVTKRLGGHGYIIGTVYEIYYDYGNKSYQLMKDGIRENTQIFSNEMKIFKQTLTTLRKEQKEISEELRLLKMQLDYMKEL